MIGCNHDTTEEIAVSVTIGMPAAQRPTDQCSIIADLDVIICR
jgi:hypothetical protein